MAYHRGHCQGTKRERPTKGTPWYATLQEEAIRKVEQEWQAPQPQQQQEK